MGEGTGIGWTDNTLNFWWGCTEVADPTQPDGLNPACADCYAREWAARLGKAKWGDEHPRIRMPRASQQADLWERKAVADPRFGRKTFVQSMSDFCENHPDVGPWRKEGWATIKRTPHLRYQILTKRSGYAERCLPEDWQPGSNVGYEHVGLMFTVVTQRDANRDVPRLLTLKKKYNITWVGLSIEPLYEPITLTPWLPGNVCNGCEPGAKCATAEAADDGTYLDWVIVGGKSQKDKVKRAAMPPYNMDAALDIVTSCIKTGTPVFHKQTGSKASYRGVPWPTEHWKGEVPEQWPPEFQVQQFPQALLQ